MMKDIMNKLANLEATAPKITKKKMLNEDSTTPPVNAETSPTRLKDIFETMAMQKPIPVVGKQGDTQQTGAGFLNVTDNSPAAQALGNALGDLVSQKKLQIVMPTTGQQAGKPAPAGATGQPQAGQMQMKEKWAGDVKLNPAKKGMFKGKTKADLEKQLAALHKSGPHKKGSPEYTKQQELNFAIRAKSGWKEDMEEGAKVDRMVKHIEKSERKLGKSKDEAENIAWATANKRGMLDNKNKKKVKEGDIAPTQGIDTKGAGLGAGRSATTLEGKDEGKPGKNFAKIAKSAGKRYGSKEAGERVAGAVKAKLAKQGKLEEAKPDFLDLDKDGNKKESMKKAAADKKKKKVDESMNHRINAARLEGKSHGLRGHAYHGKAYEDLDEMKAYHEGFKEGLDECYGMGVYETAPAMPAATVGGMADDAMDEGNAFTAALAKTPKGGKFSVGGKTFTDTSSLEEYAFESLDKQLNDLLNEGLSVSVSKGQQNAPDSVTITAQDAEAEQLLQLVKHAGLGLFGDEAAHEPSSAMSLQPSSGEPDEVGAGGVDVEVVDGHDGIMGLMQKLSGIQSDGHSDEDYADEEGEEEHTCNECGMMETDCGCSGDKEKVDEVETEDQMEFEVAEDNAPDSGAQDSVADEDAEAKEDADIAGADAKDEREVNESFFDLLGRLSKLAESKEEDEEDEEDVTESKDDEDDGDDFFHNKKVAKDKQLPNPPKEIKIDEWANQAGKGPGKGTDASFEQDIDFMTKVIAGGLNKPKSTGQTTAPIIAGQEDRMHDNPKDWATLAGIKK